MNREISVSSLQEFIDFLDQQSKLNNSFYFRGEERDFKQTKNTASGFRWMSENRLQYGEENTTFPRNYCDLLKMRQQFFSEIGYSLTKYEVENFIAYCQHHGLPTELLDISENPLVALYFACQNEDDGFVYCFDKILFSTIPTQYSLIKDDISRQSFDLLGFGTNCFDKQDLIEGVKKIEKKKVNSTINCSFTSVKELMIQELKKIDISSQKLSNSELCQSFLENLSQVDNHILPYFVHKPSVRFDRMVNQQGLFVVQQYFLPDIYQKLLPSITIKIKEKYKARILEQLDYIGINQKFVYPDIDNIASYIKEKVAKSNNLVE
ncbi:FRG domain-containing protein [Streptococcus suis]|uniref:FRG domain-containing protein n=1 Tax=Streptococcus suis TaxID=1307 RepID=UPI002A78A657|nr:FRG domain-containing protein [Streptococcus suis]MDY7599667.1 FRG domain-containing protein [Streptococcus suis]HEL1941994.1 FRG domain-containing protein [Streptococcus suis]HEL2572297.1 FRG domain-containing protein [Streptococcus suis]